MKLFRKKESPGSVTLIPYGRLASRLRTIASAIDLFAEMPEKPVEIIWFETEEFTAPFERLFTLSPRFVPPHITIREGDWRDRCINDTPAKSNLFVTAPFLFFRYDLFLSPTKCSALHADSKDFRGEIRSLCSKPGEKVLLSTNLSFSPKKDSLIYRYLEPTVEVKGVRNSRMSGWGNNVVGVHLSRKGDKNSYSESPTELFIQRMQKMIEDDPTTTFFLATTDPNEQERLQTIFHKRVFALRSITEPGSHEQVIEAFGELLALSNTRKILTTPHSKFSEVAAEMGRLATEQLSIFNLG